MSLRVRDLPTGLTILALVAGCATTGSSARPTEVGAPSATRSATPTQSATALVYGSQICEQTSYSDQRDGNNEIAIEHFRCTYQVNDPRLDEGQIEVDVITTWEPAESTAARWEATVTITTAEGVWTTENYRGALVFWSDVSGPYNYAEATYTGSGAYEGLVYHELIAGGNAVLTVSGSIERAGQ